MSKLIAGSQYSLGLLFEILLNLDQDVKVNEPGCLMQATSPIGLGDLEECVSKIQTYLNSTAENDWADSITLRWLPAERGFGLEAFSFKGDRSHEVVSKIIDQKRRFKKVTITDLYEQLK